MGSSCDGRSSRALLPPAPPPSTGVTPLRGTGWKAMGDRQPLGSLRLALQDRGEQPKTAKAVGVGKSSGGCCRPVLTWC